MKDKKKLSRLQKKHNDLLVEYELTKGNFEDFAESSAEQTKKLLVEIEHLTYTIIFRNHIIEVLKNRISRLERQITINRKDTK